MGAYADIGPIDVVEHEHDPENRYQPDIDLADQPLLLDSPGYIGSLVRTMFKLGRTVVKVVNFSLGVEVFVRLESGHVSWLH